MAEIRFEGVEKRFRDVTVIKELDLTIKDGEFFTFVGPSGCGKSTLLNMIVGIETTTEGKIYFDGVAVNDLSPKERKILEMRHGLTDGVMHTLEEVGQEFGVTRERIRQIEAKAHEKIRQHQNINKLRSY